MAKVKDILVHVSVEIAVKKRKCHRSAGKHGIQAGDSCLVVRAGLGRRNYCHECAGPILDLASARLIEIRRSVTG